MKETAREIYDTDGSVVVVIHDGDWDRVYRRRTDEMHYRAKKGQPSDQCEFFTIKKDRPDSEILELVRMYERGQSQGWADGQWQLRWDFKNLMHIRQD